ncbi:hypothetical protein WN51_11912 [Melipona quadrifasciata]|uniref:Uncharacterized protein n=1 Tax=Melipona quadrifasciata TaxID=166423 RepID=A0A0N0BHJ8_9HYME|nr:hypothetical protein WN51_11912 [Melipona quadrifasciata]
MTQFRWLSNCHAVTTAIDVREGDDGVGSMRRYLPTMPGTSFAKASEIMGLKYNRLNIFSLVTNAPLLSLQ